MIQARTVPKDPNNNHQFEVVSKPVPKSRARCCSSTSKISCALPSWFRRFIILLVFHSLNGLLSVAGFILAVVMLAVAGVWALWTIVARALYGVGGTLLRDSVCCPLIHGYLLVMLAVGLVFIPTFIASAIGAAVYYPSGLAVEALLKADFQLTKLVDPSKLTLQLDTLHRTYRTDGYDVIDILTDPFDTPPHQILTRRAWKSAQYFISFKSVVGMLSIVAVGLVVAQPLIAICTSGNDPLLSKWVSYEDKPVAYVLVNMLMWAIGLIAMLAAAPASVKLTYSVCEKLGSLQLEAPEDIDAEISPSSVKQPLV